MRKILLLSTIIAALPFAARAELFVLGSSFTVTGTNAPDSFTSSASLIPGPQSLDGGNLLLTVSTVATAGGGEWILFDYNTPNAQPIGHAALNWALSEVGVQTAVATNFDQSFASFDINGANEHPTSSVFPGFSVVANPVPGGTGFGLGATGFSAPFPAGPLSSLGSFINPWGQLDATGINSTTTSSYEEALHFSPQVVVSTPEPYSIALLGFGVLGLGFVTAKRRN
jgi:hypothetical protein